MIAKKFMSILTTGVTDLAIKLWISHVEVIREGISRPPWNGGVLFCFGIYCDGYILCESSLVRI